MKTNEELCTQYQIGNHRAGDDLWMRNKRLIYTVLQRLRVNRQQWEDAESAAAEGFAIAMRQWRPERGRFSTYAVNTMTLVVRRDLRKAARIKPADPSKVGPTFEDVHLRLLIQQVAERYRPTVRLRLAGHTWQDASVPAGAHRNHVYRPTRRAVANVLGL